MKPQELTADSAYGSDENHQRAKRQSIELISPVPGKSEHAAWPNDEKSSRAKSGVRSIGDEQVSKASTEG